MQRLWQEDIDRLYAKLVLEFNYFRAHASRATSLFVCGRAMSIAGAVNLRGWKPLILKPHRNAYRPSERELDKYETSRPVAVFMLAIRTNSPVLETVIQPSEKIKWRFFNNINDTCDLFELLTMLAFLNYYSTNRIKRFSLSWVWRSFLLFFKDNNF